LSKKLTLDLVRELVEVKGFKLLTVEYKDNNQKLDVICSEGHLCHPTAKSIRNGGGCATCYNDTNKRMAVKAQPHKIQEAKDIAISHGGKCLSETYINNRKKLKFICSEGHKWETDFKTINHGSWCPTCQLGGSYADKLELAKETALKRGGKLVSEYISLKEKMIWECDAGHKWEATFQNVIYKHSWCPHCSSSFSENICRQYLEFLFRKPFPKIRPLWLTNYNDKLMELDGYCKEIGIAFEHQGLQHYENISCFKGNTTDIQIRDSRKRFICQQAGVILIEIPALFYITALDLLHTVIGLQLDNTKIKYDLKRLQPASEIIDFDAVNLIERDKELQKIKDIAQSKGGDCLSTIYSGHNCTIKLVCGLNHEWTSTPTRIKNGNWCSVCSHKTKISIADIQKIAGDRGGVCLSTEYKNNYTKLEWQCSCGNVWMATYNAIQRGDWCPKCGIIKRSKAKHIGIEAYQVAAEKKGGQCLSTSITSCFDKIELECAEGHRWCGRADQIKNTKQWCPECAVKKRIVGLRKAA